MLAKSSICHVVRPRTGQKPSIDSPPGGFWSVSNRRLFEKGFEYGACLGFIQLERELEITVCAKVDAHPKVGICAGARSQAELALRALRRVQFARKRYAPSN
jgi:hypothetical protein